MLMDMCLHKFEIYQGTVAPKRGTQTLDTLVSPPPLPPIPVLHWPQTLEYSTKNRLEMAEIQQGLLLQVNCIIANR